MPSIEGPPQHQNPIELLATVAEWQDGTLTIYEATQNTRRRAERSGAPFGIQPSGSAWCAWSAGGGFGQKNSLQMQTVARCGGRAPARTAREDVVPRWQIFHDASFRPADPPSRAARSRPHRAAWLRRYTK